MSGEDGVTKERPAMPATHRHGDGRPSWVRTEATRYAWEHHAYWRADALAYGDDQVRRLRLLHDAVALFANRPGGRLPVDGAGQQQAR